MTDKRLEVTFKGKTETYGYTFKEQRWLDYFSKAWRTAGHKVKEVPPK